MLPLLVWVPVLTSLVLGLVYLAAGEGRPAAKIIGVAIFALAVSLQFFSRFVLAGLLLQAGLALTLAVWRKANAAG